MSAGPDARARVVVVDDDRLIRELVSDAIGDRARVECCDSSESALDALHREPADLIVSDITMPGLSGLELLEEVRRIYPATDFLLLTGHATVESAVRALRMGAADYLAKPVNRDELVLVVERILEQRRLLAENEKLRENLITVESCRNLIRCLEPAEVYTNALDLLLQHLPRQRGLALFHRSSIPTDGIAFRGFSELETRALRDVLVGEKPIDIDAIERIEVLAEGPLHNTLREIGIECEKVAAVPMRGSEKELGVLWLFEDGRPFGTGELDRAKLIAGHAELALRNAERYNEAKDRAFIDDVTEVYNARYLLQATDREIHRADRYGNPLTVLFLDLDRFKLVNDQYGHLVGSRALRRLSEVLLACIRQVDTLARYGGDEFTILLPDTPHDVALDIAERIRKLVEDTLFEAGRDTPFRLSISIGVGTFPQHGRDRTRLLDVADKAMYRAKSLGRNCVCSAADL
ncbi:MAG: diguanylate cyclase [Deltaproteobacteria bacterium]|jgi:diguanylate cyclase (GGDEF)-like protein|nr:diguanylate cyclase [Deltaproteobacteria bacterium]